MESKATKKTLGLGIAIGCALGAVIGIIAGVVFNIIPFIGVFIGLGACTGLSIAAGQVASTDRDEP